MKRLGALLAGAATLLGFAAPVMAAEEPTPDNGGCRQYTATIESGEDLEGLEHWAGFILDKVGVGGANQEERIVELMDPIDSIWLCLTSEEISKANDLLGQSPIVSSFGEAFEVTIPGFISGNGPGGASGGATHQEVPAGLRRIGVPVDDWIEAGRAPSSAGVSVAILDTGVDARSDDLNVSRGYNCTHDARGEDGWGIDFHGHGTAMASIVGAELNNTLTVGVNPGIDIISIPVLGMDGSGSSASVLCGVSKALEMGADIASLSLGGESLAAECGGFDPYTTGFCRAIAQGLVVVASAGNDALDSIFKAPANMPGVITVSALGDFDGEPGGLGGAPVGCELGYYQSDDQLAFFSNWGSTVEVISPGVCNLVVLPGNRWGFVSGTSPATPFVVGVIAHFMVEYPDCDGADAWKAVLGYANRDEWTEGFGAWMGDKGPDKEPLIRYIVPGPDLGEENPCKIGTEES